MKRKKGSLFLGLWNPKCFVPFQLKKNFFVIDAQMTAHDLYCGFVRCVYLLNSDTVFGGQLVSSLQWPMSKRIRDLKHWSPGETLINMYSTLRQRDVLISTLQDHYGKDQEVTKMLDVIMFEVRSRITLKRGFQNCGIFTCALCNVIFCIFNLWYCCWRKVFVAALIFCKCFCTFQVKMLRFHQLHRLLKLQPEWGQLSSSLL